MRPYFGVLPLVLRALAPPCNGLLVGEISHSIQKGSMLVRFKD